MVSPSSGRPLEIKGAPDYDDPDYWDFRFSTGRDVGEWLNTGNALLDAVLADLEGRYGSEAKEVTPRALHLGPGISKLGVRLQEAFTSREWLANGIINVDFSSEAVRIGQEAEERKDISQAMQWIRIDLRSWTDVASLSPFAPFDVIVDKSTCDAICTSEPLDLFPSTIDDSVCPTIRELVEQEGQIELSCVEAVAMHLVPLTQKGTTWVAMSYSTFRFDNREYIGRYWEFVSRTPLKAPSGEVSSTAHAPVIYHWLYVLRRI